VSIYDIPWLVFPSIDDADQREEEISVLMGYPRPSADTVQTTLPIEHPTDDRGAFKVKDGVWSASAGAHIDVASLLTQQERDSLVTTQSLKDDGWFPDIQPGGE